MSLATMSHKPEQLASSMQRAIQDVIARGFADPRVRGLITVTGIKVTPDLQHAEVSVSILPSEQEELTMHGLSSAGPYIRREIGKVVQTRRLPQLGFRLDRSLKKAAVVLTALEKVRAEREAAEARAANNAGEPAAEGGAGGGWGRVPGPTTTNEGPSPA